MQQPHFEVRRGRHRLLPQHEKPQAVFGERNLGAGLHGTRALVRLYREEIVESDGFDHLSGQKEFIGQNRDVSRTAGE